ncbi:RNA methyltransferase [Pseudenhygromyxa sp. WMMC2535]|uniref:TrmH family RNA methyltransferase n=1 Tax=Pseudenhygromyxa sp. WMMC2535 TaxID=2712867 RepID=UPI00155439EC|nr:RNA methyltransferase [Pseudenhygromyxa sp. WMMC2535]
MFELERRQIVDLVGFDFHRGVLACARRPALRQTLLAHELEALERRAQLTLIAASGLADPRNLGALIRNAAAFDADGVIVDAAGADPFSRLAIRASVGNVFRVPLWVSDALPATLAQLRRELGMSLVAATPSGEHLLGEYAAPARLLLLVGNEGAGLPADTLATADARVSIPMVESADSINVAAASAVLLFGLRRG